MKKNGPKTVFFCILHHFVHYMITRKSASVTLLFQICQLSYPEISRHYYPPPPTTGTREALMEPLGTIWNYLERPKGYWNARSATTLTLKCVNFVNFVNFL